MPGLRYRIETFGCQMNVHDSQRIEDALRAHGWTAVERVEDAELVVFNTCSVREKAEHKLRSEVGRLRPIKRARPELVVAVAGCVAQQEGEALLDAIAHVDVVVGPDNLGELPALVETARLGGPPVARTVFDVDAPTFLSARPIEGSRSPCAFVTTMKGCDERCSFCVVPYTRGPERYRPMREIVDEIAALVDAGTREVTLLGQTVNSWLPPDEVNTRSEAMSEEPRARDDAPSKFAELLRTITREIPSLSRLRYTSPHPRHVTPALVAAHAELDALAQHVHLPVQSGSDRVLRRMIRRYSRAQFVERARALMQARKGLTLSTDVIVGFPGETDDDFEQTLSLVREVGFVAAFGFKFSPRPYTPALRLADDVPERVKSERLARLFEAVEVQQRAHLASLVGTRARVLIEGTSGASKPDDAGRMTGRSERNEIVHLDVPADRDGAALVGRMVDVSIVRAHAHSLLGALDVVDVASLPARATSIDRAPRRLPLIAPT
jgi:tRNA-2-methylthio-N6-dimethylallyladenosine synthase